MKPIDSYFTPQKQLQAKQQDPQRTQQEIRDGDEPDRLDGVHPEFLPRPSTPKEQSDSQSDFSMDLSSIGLAPSPPVKRVFSRKRSSITLPETPSSKLRRAESKTEKECEKKVVKESSLTQMCIDAGQEEGAITCPGCGMIYIPGTVDDITHAQFHGKKMRSLTFTDWKKHCKVIETDVDGVEIGMIDLNKESYNVKIKLEDIVATSSNPYHYMGKNLSHFVQSIANNINEDKESNAKLTEDMKLYVCFDERCRVIGYIGVTAITSGHQYDFAKSIIDTRSQKASLGLAPIWFRKQIQETTAKNKKGEVNEIPFLKKPNGTSTTTSFNEKDREDKEWWRKGCNALIKAIRLTAKYGSAVSLGELACGLTNSGTKNEIEMLRTLQRVTGVKILVYKLD